MKTIPVITFFLLLFFTIGLQAQTVKEADNNVSVYTTTNNTVVDKNIIPDNPKENKVKEQTGYIREHFTKVIVSHTGEKAFSVQEVCTIVATEEQKGGENEK